MTQGGDDTWGDTELKRASIGGAAARPPPPPNHRLFSAVGAQRWRQHGRTHSDTDRRARPGGGSHAVRLPDGDGDSDGDEEETMGGDGYTPCCAGSYLPRRMFLGGWQGERRGALVPPPLSPLVTPSVCVSPTPPSVPGPTGSRRVPVPGRSTHTHTHTHTGGGGGVTDTAPTLTPHAWGQMGPGLSKGSG